MSTNKELLESIESKVHELDVKFVRFDEQALGRQKSIDRLVHLIEGNGKDGLIDRVDYLSDTLEYHLDEHKKHNNNSSKRSDRKAAFWDKVSTGVITGAVLTILSIILKLLNIL